MENLARSKTPEQKLRDFLEFGKAVMKVYRLVPDPQQLAIDARVYLKANLTLESLTEAFESYRGLKESQFPPTPGQLMALIQSRDETTVKPFVGFSDEDRRQAAEAEGSPEKKKFEETLKRVAEGTIFPKQDTEQRKAELRAQAERVSK